METESSSVDSGSDSESDHDNVGFSSSKEVEKKGEAKCQERINNDNNGLGSDSEDDDDYNSVGSASSDEEDQDDFRVKSIQELLVEVLMKILTPCGLRVFLENGSLNVESDGLLGENKEKIHDYFLKKDLNNKVTGGKGVDEIADIMLAYGVTPGCETKFLMNVLCCKKVGDAGLKDLVSRRKAHTELATYYEEHRKTYQNANTKQACDQAVSEFVEYSIYAISCNSMFGVGHKVLNDEVGYKTYEIFIDLAHFGLTEDDMLNANIGADVKVEYKFVYAVPRSDQPGSSLPGQEKWTDDENLPFLVMSDRYKRDTDKDLELLNLLLAVRYRVFMFARSKKCEIQHYSLLPENGVQTWHFGQLMLAMLDTYRTFACDPKGIRAKLYGYLAWTNVTETILSSLKMVMRNHEFFTVKDVDENERIIWHCYHSPQAKKTKLQSMERILTPEFIRKNKGRLAKNLVLPLTEEARESYHLFLLITGERNPLAHVVLTERNIVHQLFTRPNTVNLMSIENVFHPKNSIVAYKQGRFIMGAESDKTGYTKGLGTRNRTIFPNLLNPEKCPVFTTVACIVEVEQHCVKDNLDSSHLFTESLEGVKIRTRKKTTKGLKVASSTASNNKFRDMFRADSSFPATAFMENGFIEDEEQQSIRCSSALKVQVIGENNSMGIYGEKKAGMTKAMRHEDVSGIMVDERAYGSTKTTDASRMVSEKRHRHTLQYYVAPQVAARDEKIAEILSDALLDATGSPVWWTYIKRIVGDEMIILIGNSLFRPDGGWINVCASYLRCFAIVAIMGYCRYPAHIRERVSLLKLPIWKDRSIQKMMKVVREGLKAIVLFQKTSLKEESLEISPAGDILKYVFVKSWSLVVPSSLLLAQIESKSNHELELARAEDIRKVKDAAEQYKSQKMAELMHGMAEFDRMTEKVNFAYNEVHRKENTLQPQAPRVTHSSEVGDPVHDFLIKLGYQEKGSEVNRGTKSKMEINRQNYEVVQTANAKFVKGGASDNAKRVSTGTGESFEADIARMLSLFHCGTVDVPALKNLPKSLSATLRGESKEAFKTITACLKTSKEVPANLRFIVLDDQGSHLSNAYLAFVNNIDTAVKVEKLRVLVEGESIDVGRLKESARKVADFIQNAAKKFKLIIGTFIDKARAGIESGKDPSLEEFKSMCKGLSKLKLTVKDIKALVKYKPEDWCPNNITAVFSNKNVPQKKWWWPALTSSDDYSKKLTGWIDPRPKAPKTSLPRKQQNKLADKTPGKSERKRKRTVEKETKPVNKKSKIAPHNPVAFAPVQRPFNIFKALTKVQRRRITTACTEKRSKDGREVVDWQIHKAGAHVLWYSDFKCLGLSKKPPKGKSLYLNDEIINMYYANLQVDSERRAKSELFINTYLFSKINNEKTFQEAVQWKVNVFEKDRVYIPGHVNNGTHWVLFVVDHTQKSITTLDSLKNEDKAKEWMKVLGMYLKARSSAAEGVELNLNDWKYSLRADYPQQQEKPKVHCGVYVCIAALRLSLGLPVNDDVSESEVKSFRFRIGADILQNSIDYNKH